MKGSGNGPNIIVKTLSDINATQVAVVQQSEQYIVYYLL